MTKTQDFVFYLITIFVYKTGVDMFWSRPKGQCSILKERTFCYKDDYPVMMIKGTNWQLNNDGEFYFHKASMDFFAMWFFEHDKYNLYVTSYSNRWNTEKKLIATADNIFEVIKYILENDYPKE